MGSKEKLPSLSRPSKAVGDEISTRRLSFLQKIPTLLLRWGVETHGISPIPLEQRIDTRLYQMFFVWFSANFNVLAISTGSAGPAFFGLGVRSSLIIILVVDIIACAIPAIFAVFGPKLGTRGMVQARFSWGYFPSILPSMLNVFSMEGFLILNCIIGGQTLASVSDRLDDTTGIIIIGVSSLVVTFFGYKVVHWYESVAWLPNVVTFIVMLGVGGKHLKTSEYPPPPHIQPSDIITFATFLASSVMSWCTMTPDYGVYHDTKASSIRIFTFSYLGFLLSSVSGHMLGAAFAAMAPAIPRWEAGFQNGTNIGGLFAAILYPVGGFGKFLIVLVSLTIPSACAPTMYTFGNSFMSIAPIFGRVPRYIYAIVSTAILIPIGIVGQVRFYGNLVNVLSVIGYWSTAFAGIILVEHFVFRRGDFSRYNVDDWDKPRRLPIGIAALLAFVAAFGIIVPCMSQVWYVGPIAKAGSGDIGVIGGFVVSAGVYLVLRPLERSLLF